MIVTPCLAFSLIAIFVLLDCSNRLIAAIPDLMIEPDVIRRETFANAYGLIVVLDLPGNGVLPTR